MLGAKSGFQIKHKDEELLNPYIDTAIDGMDVQERRVKEATCQCCLMSETCKYDSSIEQCVGTTQN